MDIQWVYIKNHDWADDKTNNTNITIWPNVNDTNRFENTPNLSIFKLFVNYIMQ